MTKPALVVKMTALDGKRDEMIAAFENFLPTVQDEPGTELYAIVADDTNADVLWVFEVYSDKEALDAHSKSSGMQEFFGMVGGLIGAPPEMHAATLQVAKGV